MLCSGSWGGVVLIYYIYFPFFSLAEVGGGSSFISFPFLSLFFLSPCVEMRGFVFPDISRKAKNRNKKWNWKFIKLEVGWSGVDVKFQGIGDCVCECCSLYCTVFYLLYCFHGRALFCIAYIGMLICLLVIGVFSLSFVLYILLYSTPV